MHFGLATSYYREVFVSMQMFVGVRAQKPPKKCYLMDAELVRKTLKNFFNDIVISTNVYNK